MWHLKTRLGTFWIVESDEKAQKYYLGCGDEELGAYNSLDKVLDDVCNKETGLLKWDEQSQVTAPHEIELWEAGPPDGW